MHHPEPVRRLPADVTRLLAHLTEPLGAASKALRQQANLATVVHYSATMIDVAVPSDADAVELPDGPIPSRALVYDEEQVVGELLVWVRGGRLVGLEQAWYTDDPPLAWPPLESVRVS